MTTGHDDRGSNVKTRVAPILCLLAVALCQLPLGTSTARAQTSAEKPRSITTPPAKPKPAKKARRSGLLKTAADAADKTKKSATAAGAAAGTRPGRPSPPAPTAGPTAPIPPSAADAAAGEIKPFETGIDYKKTSPRTKVTFNLEDADLPDLVRLISQITGKRFILPSKARSLKATVYAPTKVTAAEAYQAFLSILELNGMALVPAGRYLKIVESGRVESRPIPLFLDEEGVPRGDRFLTRLHRVKHMAAEDAASLLERFKSGDGSLTAYAPSNLLIITDTGTNIRRMLRILGIVDISRTGEQIWVEPVHHADASDMAARLTEIFEVSAVPAKGKSKAKAAPKPKKGKKGKGATTAAAAGPGSTTVGSGGESRLTKIIADERTNSLIIVATESAYLRILEMLRHLDVSMEGEGRIHVHRLQYSDAEEIASTLSALTGKGGSRAKGKGKAGAGAPEASIFEGKVAVTSHAAANALVITSSMHDYAAVRHVIDKLDQPRKQVFIETVIMELDVTRSSSLGISFHSGVPNFPTDDSFTAGGFDARNTIFGLPGGVASGELLSGLAVGIQGPEVPDSGGLGISLPSFGVAIKALAGNSNANVLSTPHLIAMDNVEAEISVGGNVPLQNNANAFGGGGGNIAQLLGQAGGAAGAGGLNPALLSGLGGLGGGAIPRQDVGTTVTLTPHINESDEIRLEIKEEISEAGPPSEQGAGARAINRTQAKTEVVVRDQQTVVIGGLMRDSINSRASKVPVLGDIPLIGALFRSSSKEKVKKNLLLFLTPYIIRSPADLRAIYERKMRERQEFLDRYFVFDGRDFEPAVDYSRTRGLIGEILRELVEIDEQRSLAAEMAARPELVHIRRSPVGAAPRGGSSDDGSINEGDLIIDEAAAEPTTQPAGEPAPDNASSESSE